MVILDNWIMNRDRPRGGNTLYWEPKERPSKVLFIDHDRSFVGTPTDRAPQADNVHWVSDDFRDEWLGFDIKRSRSSSEYVDILSRKEPNGCELLLADFAKPLRLMQETNADAIRGWVGNIPREWGLEDLTETWVNRFLTRRDLVVEAFRREYGHVPI
jgi:hypothetical protein